MSTYDDYLKIRCTSDQKEQIESAARAAGYSNTSDYARSLLFPSSWQEVSGGLHIDRTTFPQRLAAVETALSSTPEGNEALTAAQKALSLINRKEEK